MFNYAGTKVRDLTKGEWNLVSTGAVKEYEEDVVITHYLVKPTDSDVSIMQVFAGSGVTLETVAEAVEYANPEVVKVKEGVFTLHTSLVTNSLQTIELKSLIEDHLDNRKSFLGELAHVSYRLTMENYDLKRAIEALKYFQPTVEEEYTFFQNNIHLVEYREFTKEELAEAFSKVLV